MGCHGGYGIFLGGLDKTNVLKTFAPHIFFDDSIKHIDAARSVVPSALVPYHSESQLNILAPQAIPDMEDRAFTPIKPKNPRHRHDTVISTSFN